MWTTALAGLVARGKGRAESGGWVMERTLRLGFFDPDPEKPGVFWEGTEREDTPENRRLMAEIVSGYSDLAAGDPCLRLCLGVFVDSPQIARPTSLVEMST